MLITIAENKTVSLILFITFICSFKINFPFTYNIYASFYQKLFLEIRQIGFIKKQEDRIRGSNCENG